MHSETPAPTVEQGRGQAAKATQFTTGLTLQFAEIEPHRLGSTAHARNILIIRTQPEGDPLPNNIPVPAISEQHYPYQPNYPPPLLPLTTFYGQP